MDIDINNQDFIANDQPSYNLIDRFPDIYENIFSYLDFKSLIDSCLVCKSWNEQIGQSLELMQKIQVSAWKISSAENDKAFETIKDWKRKICHLTAMNLGFGKYQFLFLYSLKRFANFLHIYFNRYSQNVWQILESECFNPKTFDDHRDRNARSESYQKHSECKQFIEKSVIDIIRLESHNHDHR